jgi:hypothetical protein
MQQPANPPLPPAMPTAKQVQDMLNPEYYLGAFQLPDGSWRTTQFCDAPPPGLDAAAATRVWERRPLHCAAVPAESAWARARWTGQPPEPQTPSEWPCPALGDAQAPRSADGQGFQQGALQSSPSALQPTPPAPTPNPRPPQARPSA